MASERLPAAAAPPPIVGLDVVGRGVHVRPRQPYALRGVLFPHGAYRTYTSRETGETYRVPTDYAINDSPPMPGRRALNQVIIEESWGRFDARMSMDTRMTAGTGPVSVDVNAGQVSSLRREESAYYAVRSSCVPLWTVYLPDLTRLPADAFELPVPAPFSHAHRRAYARFFERYGTHVVRRVWVGGQADLVFSVTKSSGVAQDQIRMALTATYGGSASAESATSREALLSNSSCTVLGKGGDELALAAMSSLDEAAYNAWLETVKANPQVIDLEAQGVWTLIDDAEQAAALQAAYHEAYTFGAVSAVFHLDGRIWFLRGDDHFTYDLAAGRSTRARPMVERWPALAGTGFERADAAFVTRDPDGRPVIHLFRRDTVLALDPDSGAVRADPRPIAEAWPGIDFERIDAALAVDARTAYFFCGQRYIRYDLEKGRADADYPQAVADRWPGLNYERLDAAIYWGNGKVYFFVDDQYIRFDMVTCRADPGFPRYLEGRYVEDWRFFD